MIIVAFKQNPALVKRAMRDMVQRARTCVADVGRHVRGTHTVDRNLPEVKFSSEVRVLETV